MWAHARKPPSISSSTFGAALRTPQGRRALRAHLVIGNAQMRSWIAGAAIGICVMDHPNAMLLADYLPSYAGRCVGD